ncbi:MAG: copper homeostasis protein CutC [Propionibacteriaceae bacterium]
MTPSTTARGVLEVIALHDRDAERAEEGGADRIELVGTMTDSGLSPEPTLVRQVRRATSIQVRVMVRLRAGFGTDGGEVTRLKGLAAAYRQAGADGLVLGFLNGHTQIDEAVVHAVTEDVGLPWTFHRAVDSCIEPDRAWRVLTRLGCDQVLTAGSVRDVEHGLDDLVQRAQLDPVVAALIVAGGGLHPEHVPWLADAGVRAFHVGKAVRPTGSYRAYVDADLVRTWRNLIDTSVRRAAGHAHS